MEIGNYQSFTQLSQQIKQRGGQITGVTLTPGENAQLVNELDAQGSKATFAQTETNGNTRVITVMEVPSQNDETVPVSIANKASIQVTFLLENLNQAGW